MATLPPIHVHLCFCVCETLAFWRRNDESTSGACFPVAILIIFQSRLLFSQHNEHMDADDILLFHGVC